MGIFSSTRVNLDPYPYYVVESDERYSVEAIMESANSEGNNILYNLAVLDPRPEFEPTRDPEPWVCHYAGMGYVGVVRHAEYAEGWWWEPRRDEFDNPVSETLLAFRHELSLRFTRSHPAALSLEQAISEAEDFLMDRFFHHGCDIEEMQHARKVMYRMAGYYHKVERVSG